MIYTPDAVRERYGFGPVHVPDYKAIAGDSSDNIPGVPGIGEKGATALIQQFGSIERILERFDDVEPKYQKKIEPAKEQMVQSKWLATIDRKVPLSYDFKPFALTDDQIATATKMLEALEFKSLVRRVPTVLGRYVAGAAQQQEPVVVESEKIGCSIDAISPRGSISSTSRTKKSRTGWRSGRSKDILTV